MKAYLLASLFALLLFSCDSEERPVLCPDLLSFGSEVMQPSSATGISSIKSILNTPQGFLGLGHTDDDRMIVSRLNQGGAFQSSNIVDDLTVEPTFLLALNNNDYLAVGRTIRSGAPDTYLARVNEQGETIWSNQYIIPGVNNAISAAETDAGNFLVLSNSIAEGTESFAERHRVEVFVVNDNSELEQSKIYNLGPLNSAYALVRPRQATEKYWAFVSVINSPSTLRTMALLELSAEGDSLGVRTFGNLNISLWNPHAAVATSDGGAVITMQTGNDNVTDLQAGLVVVKLDREGDVAWEQNIETVDGSPSAIVQLPDEGYAVYGQRSGFRQDVTTLYLLRLNATGEVLWCREFSLPERGLDGGLTTTPNGGFFLTGSRTGEDGQTFSLDLWTMELDGNGVPVE